MTENTKLTIPVLGLVTDAKNIELCEAVLDMFQTVPQGMTSFQIQNFVLSDKDFPTADGKWWQAKLELWVRLQNVVQMHYDHRKRSAKIKELEARIMEQREIIDTRKETKEYVILKAEAVIERLTVNIEENEFACALIVKGISDKMKEMESFWEAMQVLDEHMMFSKDDKEEQEASFWSAKARYDEELVRRFPELFGGPR